MTYDIYVPTMPGIVGYGVYIPRYKIKLEEIADTWNKEARGEKSVTCYDEDPLTMAIEASQNALRHSGIEASDIKAVYVASISPTFTVKSSAAYLVAALNLSEDVLIADLGGSERAGSVALKLASNFVGNEKASYALVVSTDAIKARPGEELEFTSAAGAVAMVIGEESLIAEFDGHCSLTPRVEIVERWKKDSEPYMRGDYDLAFVRRVGYGFYVPNCMRKLVDRLGRKLTDYKYIALQQPDMRRPLDVVRELKISFDQVNAGNIVQYIGDIGCASMLMSLAAILDVSKPGDQILAVSYGGGAGSDAFSIVVKDLIEEKRKASIPVKAYIESKEYIGYAKYLRYSGIIKSPW